MALPRRHLYIQNLVITGEQAYSWAKDVAKLRKRKKQVDKLNAEIRAIQAEPMSHAELRAKIESELERNRQQRMHVVYALLAALQEGESSESLFGTNELYNALAIPELMKEEFFAAIPAMPTGSSQASKRERIAGLEQEIARIEEEMHTYRAKAEWFTDRGESLPPEDWLRVAEWLVEEWIDYARYFSEAVDWNGCRLTDPQALEAYHLLELHKLPKAVHLQPGFDQ
jgi:hypothetical protein